MQGTTVEQLNAFEQQIKSDDKQAYKPAIKAAIEGLQDEQAQIRSEALSLFDALFAHGYGFQEAAELIKSGRIKETLDHKRLTSGLIQLFHTYNQEALLK